MARGKSSSKSDSSCSHPGTRKYIQGDSEVTVCTKCGEVQSIADAPRQRDTGYSKEKD